MSEQNQHSEALFDTLSKNKKKRRRKLLRTVLIVIAVIAVILVCLVFYLRQKVERRFADASAEVLRYEVTTGTIHTVVSGSGTLVQVDEEEITVPAGVEITEVLVENRDAVTKGDILASVDMATVMTALADVQEQMDTLDDEIADAKGDTVSSTVTAGVAGRVKRILAEAGIPTVHGEWSAAGTTDRHRHPQKWFPHSGKSGNPGYGSHHSSSGK